MAQIQLDTTYINNSIKTATYELRFKYNTDSDYFYFDLYDANGTLVRLHNKVVTGYNYGVDGLYFTSNTNQSYATQDNVTSFSAVIDG
jgi:hypothetical protein